jgi:thermitase
MKGLRYLAIVLTLVELALVTYLVHGVSLARENAAAYSISPVHYSANTDNSDVISDASSPKSTYTSDNSYTAQRWGVNKIEAPQAWQIAEGGQSIIVAVLDTGIDEDNQDLAHRVMAEANFTNSPTSDDLHGHGTHMAGTIAAIAPECRLMNVKVADDAGRCEASVVARGITWAVDRGAMIISISLCMKSSPDLEEAVDYAWSQGAVIVAAAGNTGRSTPSYPAYYANCLAVASTDENDSLALLSSYGDWVDVAAPGFNIYSEVLQNQYGYKSGTSPAVAHVSGEAALVFSVAEDVNGSGTVNDEVRQAIENSCDSILADGAGSGRVNAFQAVMETISSPSPSPSP